MAKLSEEDEKRIKANSEAWFTADEAEKKRLHDENEAIRAGYGYSGGADGSQNIALKNDGDWIGSNPKYNFADTTSGTKKSSLDYGTYEDDLSRLKEAQKKYQIQQLKSARDTALNNLNAQEQNIKPAYQNARNMTSASSQQGARSFAEYLANRGLQNSGASAQGEMNRLSTLQNNLGNINTQEANAYRDIANQKMQVENNYANGMASANAQIESDYLNNLLNYNEQQRQYMQNLQNQANYQYADDYQARINELLAQGYSPNSMEVLQLQALRGNKIANNNANAYNYSTSMGKIQSGNWNYNDLLATGMTQQQAQQIYQNAMAQAQAQAEQQAYENYIKQVQLNNATALNNANIANKNASTANYYDQINKRGSSKITEIENQMENMTADEARVYIDQLQDSGFISPEEWNYLDNEIIG